MSSASCMNFTKRPGVPIVLVTGFLGSGKTSLVNHILHNTQGLRCAVFVNEFGQVGLDQTLIKSQALADAGSLDEDKI
eukprot:g6146.t1